MRFEISLLLYCLSLAAGEATAAAAPGFSSAWPAVAVVLALAVLAGHAFAVPLWRHAAMFLLGLTVFFAAEAERGETLRFSPWLRGMRRREMRMDPGRSLPPAARAVRDDISRRVGIGLERQPEAAAINRALLLGEKSGIPRETRNAFVRSGTIHVFAISGLHVMIVAGLLAHMLSALLVPRRFAGAAALPAVWAYVFIIGAPPSAVRAAAMASLRFAAPVFWRKPSDLTAWSLTFLAVHLAKPGNIEDVGCRLSFAVMLAVIAACRFAERLPRGWRRRLSVGAATWAAGLPIAAQAFGRITPGGLVANIALVPAAGFAVHAGALGALSSCVSERLAAHFNNAAALVAGAMEGISRAVASLPGANFEVCAWTWAECAAYYAAIAGAAFIAHGVRSRRCI